MSAKAESDLAKRGRALPQGQELLYISKPTPTTQRWVFQGSGPVLLSYREALLHVTTVEAASVRCDGYSGVHQYDGTERLVVCSTCGHRWDFAERRDWGPDYGVGHLPLHWRARG